MPAGVQALRCMKECSVGRFDFLGGWSYPSSQAGRVLTKQYVIVIMTPASIPWWSE